VREVWWDGSLNTPLVGEKGMLTDGCVRRSGSTALIG
jgi:hypothetical protein